MTVTGSYNYCCNCYRSFRGDVVETKGGMCAECVASLASAPGIGQWDYSNRHGPTCNYTLVGGTCNCPHGRYLQRLRDTLDRTLGTMGADSVEENFVQDCYRVVKSSGDVSELQTECSRLMLTGWTPHGGMVIAAHFDQRGVFVIEYYQPMTRAAVLAGRAGGIYRLLKDPEPKSE